MNKRALVIFAVITVVVLWIVNRLAIVKRLTPRVAGVRNFSLRNGQLAFDLLIGIRNPTQGALRVKGVDFDLYSAGQYFGKAQLTNPVNIEANQETILGPTVRVDFLDLAAAGTAIRDNFRAGKLNLDLKGLVLAEGFQVPYEATYQIPVPAFLRNLL